MGDMSPKSGTLVAQSFTFVAVLYDIRIDSRKEIFKNQTFYTGGESVYGRKNDSIIG